MSTPINMKPSHLVLSAWSDALKASESLAHYTIHDDGFIDIQPSDVMKGYFEGLGLPLKANGYELDTHHAPFSVVAKALGINADDQAVREVLVNDEGAGPSARELIEQALAGFPGQVGALRHGKADHYVEVNLGQALDDSTPVIDSSKLSPAGHVQQGLLYSDVMVHHNGDLRHAYVATCEQTNNDMAIERLSIIAATLKSLKALDGVVADDPLTVSLTDAGEPALLCIDRSRPAIPLQGASFVGATPGDFILVDSDVMDARALQSPANASLRNGTADIRTYLKAHILKSLAQDALDGVYGAARVGSEGQIMAGRVSAPSYMGLDTYKLTAKAELADLTGHLTSLASRVGQTLKDPHMLAGEVRKQVTDTAIEAKSISKQFDALLVKPAAKATARVRYEDDGMSM